MTEIFKIIKTLKPFFPRNFKTFELLITGMLCMSGSKTMLNLSRWSNVCYRTIERFYDRKIPWLLMNLILIINFIDKSDLILAADETTVSKSGKKTYGLDYFFSSLLQKPSKSLCFSGISIINPDKRKSYPLMSDQLVFTSEEKAILSENKKKTKKAKAGRPIGSKNNKSNSLAPTFRLLKDQFTRLEECMGSDIDFFVGDGKYGNNTCSNLCSKFGYYLISKLQYNSALFFKYDGNQKKSGRTKIYGKKLEYNNLPCKYLVHEEVSSKETIRIYQMKGMLNKSFDLELNVVIVVKIVGNKSSHVIFFSTDLEIDYQRIIDYYSSRFQIEFNFRDAKEFWGLEDFMNTKAIRVHNAANFAFFMVNLSNILLDRFRISNQNPKSGIRDLINSCRADKYYNETLKLVRKFNPNILIPETNKTITSIGHIHV